MSTIISFHEDPFSGAGISHEAPIELVARSLSAKAGKTPNMALGIITGVAVPLAVNPFDVGASKQVVTDSKKGFIATLLQSPYKGIRLAIASNICKYGVLLGTIPVAKEATDCILPEPLSNVSASALAGVAEAFATSPFSLFKLRIQSGLSTSITEIWRDLPEGKKMQTLFRGACINSARNGLYAAICFPGIPVVQGMINRSSETPSALQNLSNALVAGGIVGASATIISHPLTVISMNQKITNNFRPACEVAKDLFKSGGIPAFFKGLSMSLPRMIVATAVVSGVSEVIEHVSLGTSSHPELEKAISHSVIFSDS